MSGQEEDDDLDESTCTSWPRDKADQSALGNQAYRAFSSVAHKYCRTRLGVKSDWPVRII